MISCKEYVEIRKEELKNKIKNFNRKPKLCVIQVGDDPASNKYTRNKRIACEKVGIEYEHIPVFDNVGQEELEYIVHNKCMDYDVDGVIVQLPLPKHIDVERIANIIPPEKDVDGFRKDSHFKSCTPKGIIEWMEYNGLFFNGMKVTVVGRSKIVGKPLISMLLEKNVTLTCCNSFTDEYDLYTATKNADVVIVAIGKEKYFDADYFNKRGIAVIDVGINYDENGKMCGDVDREDCLEKIPLNYVTPVPDGVGKLTVCALLNNVVDSYCSKEGIKYR